jgi:acetyl-CoA carboxylase carboxyl transferase subunit alpha
MTFLDFETTVTELEGRISDLRKLVAGGQTNIADEVSRLQAKVNRMLQQIYTHLEPAQKVQVARHPTRPHASDYINELCEDFIPLAGDRSFADDPAIIAGVARMNGQSVVVMGQEKGKDTETRVKHNFGMAKPEGYRKAQRLMHLAEHFNLPVVTFVDTAGAYPGIDAEERGQAEAIAKSIETCLRLGVPLVSTIIGEGGSGGAIAIAAADRVFMLEHSVYSVISPEGCASILWRSAGHAEDAAAALRLTAQDLLGFGIIDRIIQEPLGGAHRNAGAAIKATGETIARALDELKNKNADTLRRERREKFLNMGRKLAA